MLATTLGVFGVLSGERKMRGDLLGVLNTNSSGFLGVTGSLSDITVFSDGGFCCCDSDSSAFSFGANFIGVISTVGGCVDMSPTPSTVAEDLGFCNSVSDAMSRARFLKGLVWFRAVEESLRLIPPPLAGEAARAVFWTDLSGELERIGIDILLRSGMVVVSTLGEEDGSVALTDEFSFSFSAH